MIARRLLPIATCTGVVAVLVTVTAPGAAATTPNLTSGASAYSAAAATGTGSLKASLALSGSLGGLLDSLVSPIVSQDLNPLVAALQGSVNSTIASAIGAASTLNASTYTGEPQTSPAPAAFPNDTLPAPCLSSGAQPCYSGASAAVNGAPLATVNAGVLSGYVEQVQNSADTTNPVFGKASVANPSVSVLPLLSSVASVTNPLVSASLVAAKANCPNDGVPGATKPATSPSVSETASNVQLLGGLVSFGVLDGAVTSLKVNRTSYTSVLSLPTVTVGGVTVAPFGAGVIVSISLSVAQVLSALGLPSAVVTALNGFTPTSSVTLSLVVGPNSSVTSRSAAAWGLGIGVNLSGSLSFNVLGLVTAAVTIPTGISGSNLGNVLDLRLAYTTCQSGVNTPTVVPVVPPALV